MEWGLLGITVAPDFAQTGHIYLQYFPSYHPASKPAGLPRSRSASARCRSRASRASRSTSQTKQLDLDSEVKIFEYDAQIYSCCHVGGGMGFDSAGNLYVTTGDTNSSQGTDGYSGNNPAAKCPTGPPNEPSSAHCGDNAISYQDARRTAGNTNDYNGKMLRIKPIPTLAGRRAAAGRASARPTRCRAPADPNGREPVQRHRGRRRQGQAGDLRDGPAQPVAALDRSRDRRPVRGVGRPGRRRAEREPGSLDVRERRPDLARRQLRLALLHGQRAGVPRPGGRSGRPRRPARPSCARRTRPATSPAARRTGGTDGWYDCNNLHNDSPNNTGLTELPHQTGTGKDAGKMRPTNVWYSRGNPDDDGNPQTNTNNGCPSFPRDRGAGNAPNYGAAPQQLCPYAVDNGMTIMDGPVYRYDENATDNSRRWPRVLGRPLVPAQQRRPEHQARPAARSGHRSGRRPADLRRQPAQRAVVAGRPTWTRSSGPTARCTSRSTTASSARARTPASTGSTTRAGRRRRAPRPRASAIGDYKVQFSSAGSGGVSYKWEFGDGQTSTEAEPDAHLRRGQAVHGDADGDVRRRRHGQQAGDRRRAGRARRRGAGHDGDARPGAAGPGRHLQAPGHRHAVGDRHRRRAASTAPSTASTAASSARTPARSRARSRATYTIDYRVRRPRSATSRRTRRSRSRSSRRRTARPNLDDEFDGDGARRRSGGRCAATTALLSFADGTLRMKIATAPT